jgi:hypothetical protein
MSVNLMVLINDAVKEKINFLEMLPVSHNGIVCESCSVPDCKSRDSEPVIIKEQEEKKAQIEKLQHFIKNYR